jgi:hypothetical protein
VPGPGQRDRPLAPQLSVLRRSYLVQCFSKVGRNVKLVEADLLLCPFDCRSHRVDEGLPQIHRDRSDGLQLAPILLQPFFERSLHSIIQNLDDNSRVAIRHHRYVLMLLLKRGLIDRQILNWSTFSSCQPTIDCFLHDSRGLAPADLRLFRDQFDHSDFEPRDRQRLSQGGELTPWFRPRDVSLTNSVL